MKNTTQAPINSKYNFFTTAKDVIDGINLKGKIAIVTGGYSGIGMETAKVLAEAGATVIIPARDIEKAKGAMDNIPNIEIEHLDLMDPMSIDSFAQKFINSQRSLHILINSAGIMAPPLIRDKRGYESQFATNHLGHFQLTARLWPALKNAKSARVISVSSRAQRLGGVNFDDPNFQKTEYDSWKAYAQSKSANSLFAVELDRLGKTHGVRAFSVHPGLIPTTNLGRFSVNGKTTVQELKTNTRKDDTNTKSNEFKTIEQGAATSVWCATNSILDGMGGVYCEDCNIAEAVPYDSLKDNGVRPWAIDKNLAKKLWILSEELTNVKFII
ncbi:SDR family NAD(P)-dependent oxidoreductase [Clostridium beijerinckii]|jgi:NAD(P)-dependent dehydrogenase (short-subunit alcohol dehydrogenase family)|uniref:SDR family NAD(P)-dependent oxidoreductase n=2 Tax=Clostridium beijerinckii TaxID=1520 RepID=A0AAE2UWD7_CLOBE|nr:SDR family NAD(P)-dependent oxidoreductase [Clostridium beijerinckii]ABR35438.1 short-chain dehydrogenase/reductase SDR [Clostridium beijerinckii NCIMB 8052]AIU03826.1 short-chain dehydrogenase/reductase SDR [Clostridium beijerinckii ATCC 35702]MBF7809919.1 SDR family NAD(P)-dependent oxidoreductase [Clostridium beijerinckii]NRT69286.1 NAD(P)-dependent dehydrogenase (short-subunit alcohol dehydrogenase family) [Clostridium beijerinckii]NRT84566.1 NAD(P)-dependent dehydrogenase (short-subuni